MTGSAADSYLPDLQQAGAPDDYSAAQIPASSRPTRRRIFVPETSAMTGPTSQTINGHIREISFQNISFPDLFILHIKIPYFITSIKHARYTHCLPHET